MLKEESRIMLDEYWDYEETKQLWREVGFDGLVALLDEQYKRSFYSCSIHWIDNPQYILKLKGGKGDLVVGWKGIHD